MKSLLSVLTANGVPNLQPEEGRFPGPGLPSAPDPRSNGKPARNGLREEGGADGNQSTLSPDPLAPQTGLAHLTVESRPMGDPVCHLERVQDGCILTDLRGLIQEANAAAATLLQTQPAFLLGKPLGLLVGPRTSESFYRKLSYLNLSGTGIGQEWELRLQPPGGQAIDTLVGVAQVTDRDGRPSGYRWVFRDISALKQAEKRLCAQKTLTDGILDSVRSVVLILDAEGRILRSSRYLQAITGHPAERLLGQDWTEVLLPARDSQAAREMCRLAMLQKIARSAGWDLLTFSGQRRPVIWSVQPLEMGASREAILVVGHDVTDSNLAREQARQDQQLADLGARLAALAHDCRNALQRSRACLELLRWKLPEQPEALALIERSSQAQEELSRFFQDMLSCAGPIRLSWGRCDLVQVWRQAWDAVLTASAGRAAVLREEGLSANTRCLADSFRLERVFRNIFENSFAACGDPVQVEVICRETELQGLPSLRITIRDNGPGLTPEQRQRIFERFYTTRPGGTGLGMTIARNIIEAHGGVITLGEERAVGVEIVILLPRGDT